MRDRKASDKKYKLRKRYGLTLSDLADLQRDYPACGICAVNFNTIPEKACHIDHEHTSGDIRGLLCHHCNLGLGNFKDSPELFDKATQWVNKPPWKIKPIGAQQMRTKTQAEIILDYLKYKNRITQIVASGFGVSRLAAVVNAINNKAGRQVIKATYKAGINCPRYAEYSLAGGN